MAFDDLTRSELNALAASNDIEGAEALPNKAAVIDALKAANVEEPGDSEPDAREDDGTVEDDDLDLTTDAGQQERARRREAKVAALAAQAKG